MKISVGWEDMLPVETSTPYGDQVTSIETFAFDFLIVLIHRTIFVTSYDLANKVLVFKSFQVQVQQLQSEAKSF